MTTNPTTHRSGRTRAAAALGLVLAAAPVVSQIAEAPAFADGGTTGPLRGHWDYRTPDSNGWFNHPVPVHLAVIGDTPIDYATSQIWVTDPFLNITGLDEHRNTFETVVTDQGVTVVDYVVHDTAGNGASGEAEFYVDTVAPSLTTTGLPADGSTLANGQVVTVGTTCSDSIPGVDTSGIAVCDFADGVTGTQLSTSAPGPLIVTAEARDVAGNVTTATRHYTVTGTSSPPNTPAKPALTARPIILGTAKVGQDLAVTPGRWSGDPTSFGFQWFRNGVAVPGATQSSYHVQSSDLGTRLRAKITAVNAYGSRAVNGPMVRVRH